MNRQYQHLYSKKKLNQKVLNKKVRQKYSHYDLSKYYTFDEMLFILDENSQTGKCNRDVSKQLFNQAATPDQKATLKDMIYLYIDNLETSKLCLLRDQKAKINVENQLKNIKMRKKAYVFIKMLQASIYSRFSNSPSFEYKIAPSDISPVHLVNSLNPVLNHQYTLQLEQNEFSIIFYESGIQIFQWVFPDKPNLGEGQYFKSVNSENVSFEVMIKYLPKDQSLERNKLVDKIQEYGQKINRQKDAFHLMCNYDCFQAKNQKLVDNNQGTSTWWSAIEKLFQFLPFMRKHVRNLIWVLTFLLLLECLASFCWPVEFLDMIAVFFSIGIFYDGTRNQYGMVLLILQIVFGFLIVKTIWGAAEKPLQIKNPEHYTPFLVACVIIKIMVILLMAITLIRKQEILQQKNRDLYGEEDDKEQNHFEQDDESIWQQYSNQFSRIK